MVEFTHVERYRSGHNGTDSKSVDGQPSVGSNPTCSAIFRDVAQFGRALRSGRRGRRFKSCHPDHATGCSAGGSALDWGSRCRRFKSCHSDQFLSPHKCLKLQCLCGFFILLLCNVTTWKNIKKHVFCSQTVVRK